MTSGYKQLYSCVTFIVFMVVVNIYKNKMHQAREREASVRAKMRGNTPMKHSLKLMNSRPPMAMYDVELEDGENWYDLKEDRFLEDASVQEHTVVDRMKEYPEQCMDMEVFYYSKLRLENKFLSKQERVPPVGVNQKTGSNRQEAQSNSSIYVFLSVLIILLIAAGVDIAKHIRAIPRQENMRRLSLQNYQALIREKQKQFRMMKQHYSQPSMSIGRSIDESNHPIPPFVPRSREEPESPRSFVRPVATLLRRQSVPALMRTPNPTSAPQVSKNVAYPKQLYRRPSMDSFGLGERSEADVNAFVKANANGSPTEMRRRVRMLHRH